MEKVWIYQGNRNLTEEESKLIENEGEEFVEKWAAHKMQLHAGFEVLHKRFLLIKVDESLVSASGCSIDESVRFVKSLEKKYNISFFDRSQMAYLSANESIESCSLQQIQELNRSGKVKEETPVFNNLIQNSIQLQNSWKIPFSESGFYNFRN